MENDKILAILFGILFLVFNSSNAFACKCEIIMGGGTVSELNILMAKLVVKGEVITIGKLPEDPGYGETGLLFLTADKHPQYRKVEIAINQVFKGSFESDKITTYVDTESECGIKTDILEKNDTFMIYKDLYPNLGNHYLLGGVCNQILNEKDKDGLLKSSPE